MVAIIYYQKITIIGVISIVLSLLSVSVKSLMFSSAPTFSIFMFNWLSIVTDFFGIFCSLAFIFYNYKSNDDDDNNSSIITQFGYIWIYQCIGMLIIIFPSIGFAGGPHLLTQSYREIYIHHDDWSKTRKTCFMIAFVFLLLFLFIVASTVIFFIANIGLFAAIAFVSINTLSVFFLFRYQLFSFVVLLFCYFWY